MGQIWLIGASIALYCYGEGGGFWGGTGTGTLISWFCNSRHPLLTYCGNSGLRSFTPFKSHVFVPLPTIHVSSSQLFIKSIFDAFHYYYIR